MLLNVSNCSRHVPKTSSSLRSFVLMIIYTCLQILEQLIYTRSQLTLFLCVQVLGQRCFTCPTDVCLFGVSSFAIRRSTTRSGNDQERTLGHYKQKAQQSSRAFPSLTKNMGHFGANEGWPTLANIGQSMTQIGHSIRLVPPQLPGNNRTTLGRIGSSTMLEDFMISATIGRPLQGRCHHKIC